ncbi:site-specific integrase [Rathayibacter rathayi]|uniref:site-specific integrase n=1 Tax=Rathayibacter rathayi TaxID=33887 RepID=UPI000BD3C130|nr:tyrosine-type recombinase/integrase [Rathayibacter rathayi]AZZ48004.1 site-specific integrase [Rathayibacter rathayi]MWV74722.1 tyrosine-type recombinase/integrase [Rathayibacter rathayi NCPPB 2980 = VKM Ac-1601]PPF50557.1 site-specific integrase [Rathayibacter rathayi]PPG13670.1 site-specific integrase [Rathayibacter rathayi]PPG45290.1 site-specific integrase [Rathayibacter rathayi]
MTGTRKTNRASFGSTRKLPSGRWQARYPDEAGRPMNAPTTFVTKREALDHLAAVQADRLRGSYIDHRSGARPFGEYARAWIAAGGSRGKLAPRTAELYLDILDHQLARLEAMPLSAITGPTVRSWYAATRRSLASAAVKRGGTGETRLRQAYALLRAILTTAVNDRLIAENPARIVGAGVAKSPERPHLDAPTFARIVSEHPADYRPLLVLAFGAHLRVGELVALERRDLDLDTGTLVVERQTITVGGEEVTTPTKTGASRTVTLPATVVDIMREHLDSRASSFGKAPLFARPDGRPISRGQIQWQWRKATTALDLTQFHPHDIRHAGLTAAAQAGATLRELMDRAGHRTAKAAMLYQHVGAERGQVIAAGIDAVLAGGSESRYGTQMARTDEDELPLLPLLAE